jgi:four helix bundle protein
MNFQEWASNLSPEITGDVLWQVKSYQQSLFLSELAWQDATKLQQVKQTISLSHQLYRAVGSISANIAEGYSRRSGKDQARFYEYALGSARESKVWYFQARHVLGQLVFDHRVSLLTHIMKQLLVSIPKQRGYKIGEASSVYSIEVLLESAPSP